MSLHAPVDKFEIELLVLSQAAKEKTRPNIQRAVTIRQVRVLQQSFWYFLIPLSDELQALVIRSKKWSPKALAYTVF